MSVKMVDITQKDVVFREAVAEGAIRLRRNTIELIKNKKNNTSAANNKANDNANGTGDSSKESIVDKIKRLRAKRG